MVDFGNTTETKNEQPTLDLFNEELEKLDQELGIELYRLDAFNRTPDRTDNTQLLQGHNQEARRSIVVLREQLLICKMYRERMKP